MPVRLPADQHLVGLDGHRWHGRPAWTVDTRASAGDLGSFADPDARHHGPAVGASVNTLDFGVGWRWTDEGELPIREWLIAAASQGLLPDAAWERDWSGWTGWTSPVPTIVSWADSWALFRADSGAQFVATDEQVGSFLDLPAEPVEANRLAILQWAGWLAGEGGR